MITGIACDILHRVRAMKVVLHHIQIWQKVKNKQTNKQKQTQKTPKTK